MWMRRGRLSESACSTRSRIVIVDQELGHAFVLLSVSRSRGPFRNVNSVSGQCYASCQVDVLTAAALA